MAEEYDDEQLGELEENDPETRSNETLDGELLAAVVEDYVFVQQEIADAEGRLGNPVRTGNRLKQVFEECEAERRAYEYDENAETEDEEEPEDQIARVGREKMELQELFKSNQYLLRQERERWDCETIVSTYSTLDNHPKVLQEAIPTRRKQKKQQFLLQFVFVNWDTVLVCHYTCVLTGTAASRYGNERGLFMWRHGGHCSRGSSCKRSLHESFACKGRYKRMSGAAVATSVADCDCYHPYEKDA
ncbi:hypothetical protein PsorP6_014106 [Peronosclerospora sorghi]|uniref:Uncharacterized protein n=1 Tax=Peronosclerospora sorghi TaxID=230839 RepID=A0ACC0VGI0_9STRA|nr:hypothetical protein PsorP6_014106 [Peronosclerospora sorghi]